MPVQLRRHNLICVVAIIGRKAKPEAGPISFVAKKAFVPTLFAQKLFQPTKDAMHAWGRLYRRRLGVQSVEDT
jgi:hypothetical protein